MSRRGWGGAEGRSYRTGEQDTGHIPLTTDWRRCVSLIEGRRISVIELADRFHPADAAMSYASLII